MTREIKFRAKALDGPWEYGDLHLRCNHPHIHTDARAQVYIDPNTVGQFTGLHDKYGKEIYEGDIVHLDTWKPDAMQIKFIEAAFCLADASGYFLGDIHYVHHGSIEQCTVLGNIYDNPKLLN